MIRPRGWMYIPPNSPLLFVKFNSTNNLESFVLSTFISLLWLIWLHYPHFYLYNLWSLEYQSMWNWETGNLLSNFVSVITSSISFTSAPRSSYFFRKRVNVKVTYNGIVYIFNPSFLKHRMTVCCFKGILARAKKRCCGNSIV